ncbi:MAG: hypothetical protein ABI647_02165 [Gemmatimonadota bacterium]
MSIPIVAIISAAGVKVAKVMAQARSTSPDPDTQARIADLEDAVQTMRQELSEAHERIEFTERLLAQPRTDKLGPPPS